MCIRICCAGKVDRDLSAVARRAKEEARRQAQGRRGGVVPFSQALGEMKMDHVIPFVVFASFGGLNCKAVIEARHFLTATKVC